MDEINILNQLIKDTCKVPVKDEEVILREEESKLTINNIPNYALIIKADKFKAPDDIFNCQTSECKRADYIIIVNQKIFVIELKKSTGLEHNIKNQLKGSYCFMEYCKKIIEQFWDKKDFLKSYEYRYVSFKNTGQKNHVQKDFKISRKNNKPDLFKKINTNTINFNCFQ